MRRAIVLIGVLQAGLSAQEANSGFELRTSISEGAFYTPQLEAPPRSGSPLTAGFRLMLYPTWKLSKHWTISGAIQTHSRPYFFEEFSTQGYGVETQVLQANLSYSQFWNGGSVVVRMGQLSTAFGSFLLHYDDADNPLIDMPMAYGYYYKAVSTLGLAGAQADVNLGKFDMRAQFVNSSPANPRSVFDRDQYGNWAGGMGYTIRQGLRVGASAYHGPYLDRQYAYYFPGEAPPNDLPATAYGLDVQWGRGPLNVSGEWQRFQFDYRAIPTFKEHTGYAEARWVLHPRWYIATRLGYMRSNAGAGLQSYEFVGGFRPNRYQLAKLGYEIRQGPQIQGTQGNTLAVQLVTSFRAISIARD
ncbi:MAG: hypothetical protein ABSH32_09470 [Bryobacteraceae bacterium]|jgi:hypothetical protein